MRSHFLIWLLSSIGLMAQADLPSSGNFSQTNLFAWCIVPFDTRKRGPEERAEMLKRLGLRRLAYDWRSEHIPTFDAEVAAMRRHAIEVMAWWFPSTLTEEAQAILACIERTQIHPQLWVTLGTEAEPDLDRLGVKMANTLETLIPICKAAAARGCTVALYNHLGWFGEPTNQVALVSKLKGAGHTNVGIVYNFHHGHAHIDTFQKQFDLLKPHLVALNLNGMVRNGDSTGRKIIPLGTGDQEESLLRIVNASGWKGPVGIIGHTEEDAEVKLGKELAGLKRLASAVTGPTRVVGEPPSSGREPGVQVERDWLDDRWQRSDIGLFLASNLVLPDGVSVAKGLTVRTAGDLDRAMAYDLATGEIRAAWSGGFLKLDPTRFGLIGTPRPGGAVAFTSPVQQGNGLSTYRYRGLHVAKDGPLLEHEVDGVRILERAAFRKTPFGGVYERILQVAPHSKPLRWIAAGHLRGNSSEVHTTQKTLSNSAANEVNGSEQRSKTNDHRILGHADLGGIRSAFAVIGGQAPKMTTFQIEVDAKTGTAAALFGATTNVSVVSVLLWRGERGLWPAVEAFFKEASPGPQLEVSNAKQTVSESLTRGQRGFDTDFLAVDTLTLPYDNSDRALLFASGVAFTPDGTGYVSMMHGDVWQVTGVDEGLKALHWKRYATGLFQPLGLQVRGKEIYVLGRDRITRLHDYNDDGVADFQESFFDGIATSTGGHDYVTCLEVDSAGRFYYVDPKGVHRVGAEGRSEEILAAGFRNPNGMGVSQDGRIVTVSPQQGTWTPSSEIIQVVEGGWYGFGGPKKDHTPPMGRDLPLCWIPHGVDNSSGSQAWIPEGQWGPLGGQMMHLLWGRSSMMLVLRDTTGSQAQGAVVPLPVKFLSGPNRATFNPRDRSLYVAGSTGWQTSAIKDGVLQRVRYTGKPIRVPISWKQTGSTLEFRFAQALDPATAGDLGSYAVKRWNYRYSEQYGSKDWSVRNSEKEGRDEVVVKAVTISPEGTAIRLELADAKPAMQYELRYNLESAAGGSLRGQLWFSLHPQLK